MLAAVSWFGWSIRVYIELSKKKNAHFRSRRPASRYLGRYCPGKHHVLAQHIHVTTINSSLDMIEFGNEAMFHPIHDHFGKYDREHWLDVSAETRKLVASQNHKLGPHTDKMVRKTPLSLKKLLG